MNPIKDQTVHIEFGEKRLGVVQKLFVIRGGLHV